MKEENSIVADIFRAKHEEFAMLSKNVKIEGKKMQFSWNGHEPAEVYINYPVKRKPGRIPAMINLHGGAFVDGDAVLLDSFCQKVADCLNIAVVNLNYKLYPDVRYPYPVEETEHVLRYLEENTSSLDIDAGLIGACGFSAGATIAFGTEADLIKKNIRGFDFIVGFYPMVSGRLCDIDEDSPYPATDETMTKAMFEAMNGYADNPICSPLLAETEVLGKFPPSVILSCGKDSLGRMGREFVSRLALSGVSVIYREFKNAYHGFAEVNRPDFFLPDERKNEEQHRLTKAAEKWIMDGISLIIKYMEG